LYFAVRDHDCLVLLRWRTRTIDDSDMLKNEDWSIDADEVRYARVMKQLETGDASQTSQDSAIENLAGRPQFYTSVTLT
jgi:hypothetical protein